MDTENEQRSGNGMRARSCSTTKQDPYRAGVELAEQLVELDPEVIFLFSSIHYAGSAELLEGIHDVLERDDLILIGSTGDGFFERGLIADVGASALALNSGGAITWRLAYEVGVGAAPREAARRCMDRLKQTQAGPNTALYYLATDFRTDACEIISALDELADAPVVGGSAGDEGLLQSCFVYANREVQTDCIAILAMDGALPFDILVANELHPMGRPAVITQGEGTVVRTIDGIPAMDFIERELGKPLDALDQGVITLKLTEPGVSERHMIRSVLFPHDRADDHSVRLFGGIRRMKQAQVCLAPPEKLIQEVSQVGKRLANLDFDPLAALIVSCTGRKRVLGNKIERKIEDIFGKIPTLTAIAGFPSFGEFGPVPTAQGYSQTMFHNMTLIIIAFGDPPRVERLG